MKWKARAQELELAIHKAPHAGGCALTECHKQIFIRNMRVQEFPEGLG